MEPENVLPHTPLSELTTAGLEQEQIWEQLELRAPGYVKVAKEIVSAGGRPEMDMDEMEEMADEDEEEEGSDEDMTEEEFRKMLSEGDLGDLTDEQIEEMMREAEAEGDSDEDSDEDEDDDDEDDDEEGDSLDGSDEDEVEFEDGTKIGSDEDLDDDEEDGDDDEEEEEDDEEDEDEVDIEMGSEEEISLDGEGEDEQAGPSRRKRHPTLDDQFFSIDDFNRMTEEAEASNLSSGRLDDDEDEELDEDVGQLMLNGVGDDEGLFFFLKGVGLMCRYHVYRFL
jgi:U3 small nucleolar RNA-associated protein MPP10